MFVICLMGKDKVFQADEAAIVNRLSTETKWDLEITSLNVSCAFITKVSTGFVRCTCNGDCQVGR